MAVLETMAGTALRHIGPLLPELREHGLRRSKPRAEKGTHTFSSRAVIARRHQCADVAIPERPESGYRPRRDRHVARLLAPRDDRPTSGHRHAFDWRRLAMTGRRLG